MQDVTIVSWLVLETLCVFFDSPSMLPLGYNLHLSHGYLCSTTFKTHKNNVIIILQAFV